ncbi:hypothetical protein [Williamsia sp. CHRR-6]|uniref:hypothetical protein n=1 Tax=Williamsia sp. CHRR-6 TaxID=2835871 RepID=UPI001BDADF49|nr:hypothetical protein [Williamsia sp. CHRR-6]MBT0567333.1 hypothetical protein [Williamsia sp. CHRR-6]
MRFNDFESGLDRFHRLAEHSWKPWDGTWDNVGGAAPPDQWVAAVAAVSRDIESVLIPGIKVDPREMVWLLSISRRLGLIMVELRPDRNLDGHSFIMTDEAGELDRTTVSATCWLAYLIQDGLAGRHHVLWPEVQGRVLRPTLREGRAAWMLSHSNGAIEIGSLTQTPQWSRNSGEPRK